MVKSLVLWGAACGLLLLCTGCWDSTEINQLAIVTASACDLAPQKSPAKIQRGHSVLASVQIVVPALLLGGQSQSGVPSGGSQGAFITESDTGPSPGSALLPIVKRLSRRFFLEDRRVIILGEPYAAKGISELLDEMTRNPSGRLRSILVVAHHGRGLDILKLNYPLNRIPADAILELEESRSFVATNLVQFIKLMTDGGDPYAMGIAPITKKPAPNQIPFTMDNVAVFRRDRMVGWLTKEETAGFYLIYEQANNMRFAMNAIAMPGYSGTITSVLTHTQSSISPVLQNHKLVMLVHVKLSNQIIENGTSLNLDHIEDQLLYQHQLHQHIYRQIATAINALQHKYDADCLQFGKKIHEYFPHQWHALAPHWHDVFPKITPKIYVDIALPGSGNLSAPIFEHQQKPRSGGK